MGKKKTTPKFGELVRNIRESQNLSLREAAVESGVDKASIRRIEMGGVPTLANFARLCRWAIIPAGDAMLEFAGPPPAPAATTVHRKITVK